MPSKQVPHDITKRQKRNLWNAINYKLQKDLSVTVIHGRCLNVFETKRNSSKTTRPSGDKCLQLATKSRQQSFVLQIQIRQAYTTKAKNTYFLVLVQFTKTAKSKMRTTYTDGVLAGPA